jgi:hypothetical protein
MGTSIREGGRAVGQEGAKAARAFDAEQMGHPHIFLPQHQLQMAFRANRASFAHGAASHHIIRQVIVVVAHTINDALRIEFDAPE